MGQNLHDLCSNSTQLFFLGDYFSCGTVCFQRVACIPGTEVSVSEGFRGQIQSSQMNCLYGGKQAIPLEILTGTFSGEYRKFPWKKLLHLKIKILVQLRHPSQMGLNHFLLQNHNTQMGP